MKIIAPPRWLRAFLLLSIFIHVSCGASDRPLPQGRQASPFERRIDAVVDEAIADGRIVGAVVLVARDGEIVYRRATGHADREANRPVREDTLFRLASMTKPIVSAAALALVDAGKLDLDDPVTRWLPDFRPRTAGGEEPTITVRHLLTHTAGLSYSFLEPESGPYHAAGVSDGFNRPGISLEENLSRLSRVPLLFAPGSQWNYSVATDVLGGVVAAAGQAPLPDVIRTTVTGPLGIEPTFHVGEEARARVAVPYVDGKPRAARMADPQRLPFAASALVYSPSIAFDSRAYPSGGAGLVGTAGDYLLFLEALRTGGGRILKPETAAAMTTNQIGAIEPPLGPGRWGFGFGVAVLREADPTAAPSAPGTWQWGGIYGSHFFVDPSARLTVVVLTNTGVAGMTGAFPDALRRAVYGK